MTTNPENSTQSAPTFRLLVIDQTPAQALAALAEVPVIEPVVSHDWSPPVGILEQINADGVLIRLHPQYQSQLAPLRETLPATPIIGLIDDAHETLALNALADSIDDYLLIQHLTGERLVHAFRQAGRLRAAINGLTAQQRMSRQLREQLSTARNIQHSLRQNASSVNDLDIGSTKTPPQRTQPHEIVGGRHTGAIKRRAQTVGGDGA